MLSLSNYNTERKSSVHKRKWCKKTNSRKKHLSIVQLNNLEIFKMLFNGSDYGVLIYDKKNENFHMNLKPSTPIAIRPSSIYGSVVVKESLKPKNYTPTSSEIYNWVCERSVPIYRQNLNSILSDNKLPEYDPWELLKKNNGKNISDAWEIQPVEINESSSQLKKAIWNTVSSNSILNS